MYEIDKNLFNLTDLCSGGTSYSLELLVRPQRIFFTHLIRRSVDIFTRRAFNSEFSYLLFGILLEVDS